MLSLDKFPKFILDHIRRKTFKLLWGGNQDKPFFDLSKSYNLAKPIFFGGWGLRKISIILGRL